VSPPLLTAPIGRSLLRLAGPTTGLMVVQILVAIAETWIVGRLGIDALAGFVLVVPFMVLMLNSANGGMGGAVAAALARALGAGRHEDARALVVHALLIGVGFAMLFITLAWTVLPTLLTAMGGSGPALQQALAFSTLWFAGAVLAWPTAFLSALLRGSGDALAPSRIGLLGAVLYVLLSGVLGLGTGGWPGLGIAGLAIASIVASGLTLLMQARVVLRGGLGFVPALVGVRLQGRLFGEILSVGLLGSVTTLTASLTATLVTSLVGRFGTAALAGYGIAMRLEFMLAPLAFGIGTGLTTLVGVAIGAHEWRRAVRVAWTGGLIAFAMIGCIGWAAALLPDIWSRLFASDPAAVAASVACITRVAPFYGLFGLGLTLNFASQGAGRMVVPFSASILRMIVATAGGWIAVERLGWGLNGVFGAIAASLAVYGCLIGGSLLIRPWGVRQ
jgi:Na+-driven multidrug efflux pump